jgi:Domain of unknown function (DUF4394)
MRRPATTILAVTAVAVLGLGLGPVAASADDDRDDRGRTSGRSSGENLRVVGLAGDHTLVRFDTRRPGSAKTLGDVRGLAAADQDLVGIDYRVQDGKLYGVGRGGGVYSIDPRSLQATLFGQLTIPLEGESFGVDFNPAANALRVVSDTGQNLRQPFAAPGATVADGSLTTPPTPGTTTGVTGAAYTNNDLDPTTATTLFDLATATDDVVLQSPANAGTLSATGKAGVDLTGDTGFDIYSEVRGGKAVELLPYAVNGGRLYDVSLLNGQLEDAGRIGKGDLVVTDLAIPLDQR